VLVIEDNENELGRLSELLSSDRVEVVGAVTAKKALSILKKEMFDCIIMDFVLPDANGLELINKINLLNSSKPLSCSIPPATLRRTNSFS
jgi:CheY-like chemotaxis protein